MDMTTSVYIWTIVAIAGTILFPILAVGITMARMGHPADADDDKTDES